MNYFVNQTDRLGEALKRGHGALAAQLRAVGTPHRQHNAAAKKPKTTKKHKAEKKSAPKKATAKKTPAAKKSAAKKSATKKVAKKS